MVQKPRRRSLVVRALGGLVSLVIVALGGAWLLHSSIEQGEDAPRAPGAGRQALAQVKSWGYQLQRVDVAEAARSPLDLLVVDEAVDGNVRGRTNRQAVAGLKRKPDGGRRVVLSYLSIGEAESYRTYWQSSWVVPMPQPVGVGLKELAGKLPGIATSPAQANIRFKAPPAMRALHTPAPGAPAWLDGENPEWRGNYRVRFWHPDWQSQIFGSREAAIDRIIAAGFDGVYLDRADVYGHWQREQTTAKDDMVRFIEQIAAYARQKKPDFLVVMQNAEELLGASHLRATLDGVAKEDLLYGIDGAAMPNSAADVSSSLRYLKMARGDGLPILVVEYVDQNDKVDAARRRIQSEGFIPYFGPRALNSLNPAG